MHHPQLFCHSQLRNPPRLSKSGQTKAYLARSRQYLFASPYWAQPPSSGTGRGSCLSGLLIGRSLGDENHTPSLEWFGFPFMRRAVDHGLNIVGNRVTDLGRWNDIHCSQDVVRIRKGYSTALEQAVSHIDRARYFHFIPGGTKQVAQTK